MHRFARLFVLAAFILAPTVSLAAENYKIDPTHGTVIFRVTHLGIGNAYGRFNCASFRWHAAAS